MAFEEPDWSAGAPVAGPRENIYNWDEEQFSIHRNKGLVHAQIYPVTVTGILPPYAPIKRLIEEKSGNPFKNWVRQIIKGFSGYESFDDVLKHLGLHPYPLETDRGIYSVPYPNGRRPETPMGFGLIERNGAQGFTFSCAACHSSNLFGKTVLGLSNRFPRANEFFFDAKRVIGVTTPGAFKYFSNATDKETNLIAQAKDRLRSVGIKEPLALGLDTSLAQVALSLNRRSLDSYATFSAWYSRFPRPDAILDQHPADSKPAVWWNLKYKNRWLSDGSVLSGNPIYTNILWNEIGRGADLHELEDWLNKNEGAIRELATAVFATEAPQITDFFPADKIDFNRARAGEIVFEKTCAKCHGHYDKAWNLPEANHLERRDLLKTVRVRYRTTTPVVDVGTDPARRRGMKSLEQLNHLKISKNNNIVIQAQNGYVPPPLVGIWARWPYMHNNSIPNLCALLTPGKSRPKKYYSGEAISTETDFDFECNGYPLAEKTPTSWKRAKHLYDTGKEGLGNYGHDEGIFLKNGVEILSAEDKKNLIVFLQTL